MTTTTNNSVRPSSMSSPSLDARIADLRYGMSTSNFLLNLLFATFVINALLFTCAILSIGTRHGSGTSLFLSSTVSCLYVAFVTMLYGDRASDALTSSFPAWSSSNDANTAGTHHRHHRGSATRSMHRLANALRVAHATYGSDPYVRGVSFGMTMILALVLRVLSNQWDGISDCVSNVSSSSSSCVFGTHAGPARAVSFLSGLLSWLYVAMAISMHAARRREMGALSSSNSSSNSSSSGWGAAGMDHDGGGMGGFGLSGIIGGLFSLSSYSSRGDTRYDEIIDDGGMGFDGDFPSSSNTIRV